MSSRSSLAVALLPLLLLSACGQPPAPILMSPDAGGAAADLVVEDR